MSAIAAVLFVSVVGVRGPLVAGAALPWWSMIVPFAICDAVELRFRLQKSVVFVAIVEIPYVVGLLTLSSPGLLLAHVVGAVIALAVLRYRPVMIAFNVTGLAIDCGIALLVFRAIVTPGSALHLGGWTGAALAMMLCALASQVRGVGLALLRRRPVDRDWFGATELAVVVAAINSTLAFLAVRLVLTDPRLVWLVGGLGVVLVIAYRNYISLLNHHEGLNRLYESTQAFELVTAQDGSVRTMLDQVVELLAAERAELSLLVDGRTVRRFRADAGAAAVEVDSSEAESALVRLIAATADDPIVGSSEVTRGDDRSMVAELQGADGPIGVIDVSMYSGSTFSEGDRRLFEMFVNHASVALQNSQLVDQLREEVAQREHEALHDSLTTLPNRVLFDLQTRRAIATRADGELVAVALIDIDHFKEVNDTLGHHHGDALLAALAKRLERLGRGRGPGGRPARRRRVRRADHRHDRPPGDQRSGDPRESRRGGVARDRVGSNRRGREHRRRRRRSG